MVLYLWGSLEVLRYLDFRRPGLVQQLLQGTAGQRGVMLLEENGSKDSGRFFILVKCGYYCEVGGVQSYGGSGW